jgi:hypothetical protein
MNRSTDRIERKVLLRAPRSGVWRALSTAGESGFDKVPPARRKEAFRMNSGGWDTQLNNIEKHVAAL